MTLHRSDRKFEVVSSANSHGETPLLLGLTGCSSSGKTWSALELATGIQRVRGGKVGVIDTESGRALHYKKWFTFEHMRFDPPHGPDDYRAAIDYMVSLGVKIIVVDSLSHEHDGEGGVLDQIEAYLDEKAGTDWKKREKLNFAAQVRPKRARKVLNRRILQLSDVTFICCYRAQQKIKPKKGAEPLDLGWQPITTSMLPYDMTARFLLLPGSQGRPTFLPETEAEQLATKLPRQFIGWFKQGDQLSADLGEKMARWAQGGEAAPNQPPQKKIMTDADCDSLIAAIGEAHPEDVDEMVARARVAGKWSRAHGERIKKAIASKPPVVDPDAEDLGDAPTDEELAGATA